MAMSGFILEREAEIAEMNSLARLFRHEKTGAELLHIKNSDENKVFGITFRTPPHDSTGVAHILEHSVLCGSRKYPVKEPFVELLKGSLQTFLNAFTYPDKTCYPVASQNLNDLRNLMDVYLDAVFHPRITAETFKQEGWHLELESPDGPMGIKGVVYNEMKGAYSSPEGLVADYSLRSLFPDTTYGLDSGGDPHRIPDLSYDDFLAFHKSYYHPSNSRIFLYGDAEPDGLIALIGGYLEGFEKVTTDSSVPLQSPFSAPRFIKKPFMAALDAKDALKGMVTINWGLMESGNAQDNFTLRILEHILLGMPGSPLRKALIDSGLGEDITGEGLGTEIRQIYFSTGLKGVHVERAEAVESLILDTLKGLSRNGIDPGTVEAALNTVEFRLRENNTGSFPRGLVVMLRALTTWLYGKDPLELLFFERPIAAVRSGYSSDPAMFQKMISEYLVSNPHRSTLVMFPDPDLLKREEALEVERIEGLRNEKTRDELLSIAQATKALKALQDAPDAPEALATIPCLGLSDLEKKNRLLPIREIHQNGTRIFLHEIPTNGIVYLNLGLNLLGLPWRLYSYLPLFGRAMLEMGTGTEDFVSLGRRIASRTGGIWPQVFTSPLSGSDETAAWLFLRGKAVSGRVSDLMGILKDILLDTRFEDRERFRKIVLEEKARQEQRLIPSGHRMVAVRIKSHFAKSCLIDEKISGISHLFFLRELAEAVENNWEKVLSDLLEIRQILVRRGGIIADFTLDEGGFGPVEPLTRELLGSFPDGEVNSSALPDADFPENEGLTIPAQVNYVGKGLDVYKEGYRFHGSSLVIMRYLRTAWLWNKVRVQGGAYGAFCGLDRLAGTLTFTSYRDPNIAGTLDVFDDTAGFLRRTELDSDEIKKAIIGSIGDMDAHLLPDAKGFTALMRRLRGDTDEERQRIRDEVLSTDVSYFREFADVLDAVKTRGIVKILGASDNIEAFKKDRVSGLSVVSVL